MSIQKNVKPIFIFLELITGFAFGILGIFIYASFHNESSLLSSVLYSILVGCVSMFIGIFLVGYFHFKTIGRVDDFGQALIWSLVIFLPFFILSLLIPIGRITILLPLSGAVIGLNLILFTRRKEETIEPDL